MKPIPPGTKGSFRLTVKPEHLASQFKDSTLPPVLATPVLIMIMENAALNAIKPYFDKGETAVGSRVDVLHLIATPIGRKIKGKAEVVRVDGRRIEFKVRATDKGEEVGIGTHERMVIDLEKFTARMNKKYA